MTDRRINWYLEALRREFEQCKEGRFTGNNEFKVNWREGSIGNINIGLYKSIQAPKDLV
jgi:hypothetical protein